MHAYEKLAGPLGPRAAPARLRPGAVRFALAAALAVAGHHWLWGDAAGLGLALTLGVFGVAAILWDIGRRGGDAARIAAASALLILALVVVLEAATALWTPRALSLAGLSALVAAGRGPRRAAEVPGRLATLALAFVGRPSRDLFQRMRRPRARPGAPGLARPGWLAPAALTLAFLALFAEANPVISAFGDDVSGWFLSAEAPLRAACVAGLLCIAWTWLRPPKRRDGRPRFAFAEPAARALFPGDAAIPSLIVFNALFAAQTGLDLWLLWGGGALPEGMTYADYAHRGAYPLLGAALLAAAFILVAFRPGSTAERAPAARRLAYLWILQIGMLVASSVLRLDLYVGAYGLTMLRAAAFVWMGLVAIGLALIA
ncbi:MAG: DUF4173 domain-containing protein, partial [Pseudomonadota bacterium]